MGVIANPDTTCETPAPADARRATAGRETWAASIVLFVILNAAFFPFLWGKKTLLCSSIDAPSVMASGAYGARGKLNTVRVLDPGSPAWQFEPSLAFTHKEYFVEKTAPLWDPYRAFGTPFAASMQSQPFYPLTILLSIHPGPKLHAIFLVARLLLAGWFGYLFFRLFLDFYPSLAGAIVLMLSGYFILYLPIAHLSVDVLIGAAFYGVERLLRAPGRKTVLLTAGVLLASIFGGMPETAFLMWCYVSAYALFRITTDSQMRQHWRRRAKALATAAALGLGSAMVLVLPFLELMRVSFDVHQFANTGRFIGMAHDSLHGSGYALLHDISIYLAPLLFGPPFQPTGATGIRGYFGLIALALALLAAIISIREAVRRRFDPVVSLALFFLASCVLFLMKRFGCGAVNWIGRLPLFSLIVYPKYLEMLQAMAVASLTAIGCSYFLDRRLSRPWIFAPLTIVLLWLGVVAYHFLPSLHGVDARFFHDALLAVCVLLLALAAIALFLRHRGEWVVMLIAVELCGNFLVPMYYILNKPPDTKHTAYNGAPYVPFLQSQAGVQWRIFGRDQLMFPNWSEAFNLFDVRSLDAMYVNRYFRFVQFFLKTNAQITTADLVDRFIGSGPYHFDTERQLRFLQLGSVKYLLARRPFSPPGSVIEQIWDQNNEKLAGNPRVVLRAFTIDGQTKSTLQEHPPFSRLPVRVVVPENNPVLRFAIGIDSAVYAPPILGGGVTFRIECQDGQGHIRKLFSKYIDPKHNIAERIWFPEKISLSLYRGQSIDLLLSTDGGKDTRDDWAGWADMQMEAAGQSRPMLFRQIYNKEVLIYRFDDVLPRAAVFHQVETARDDTSALSALGDPKLDVFARAVVSANTLTSSDRELLQQIERSPEARGEATITHYGSQDVMVSASLDHPGLLVLNDTEYPGWKAYVDGRVGHIVSANYLFRGVFLPAGRHQVEFKYQPESFRLGLLLSCLTVLAACVELVWTRRHQVVRW